MSKISSRIHEIFGEDDHDSQNQATGKNNQEGNNESQSQESGSQFIPVEVEQPHEIVTGMQFPSLDSLFDAYQEHARVRGFSVLKRTSTNVSEEDYKYVLMVCDKSRASKAQKSSKRVYCKAR
ncbi:hypothetical protein ACS0TY_024413 [Phlomoides rotata]